jgi:preprotein translocase subunit SecA
MLGLVKKVFGTAESRKLKKYRGIVDEINRVEIEYQRLSDDELRAKAHLLSERAIKGEELSALLPEAYALVKNTCRRLMGTEIAVSGYHQKWDMIPYDVQLLGAVALFDGNIAEMQTGEGKTLTASLPLFLHALKGKAVHLVTVNDYLARRDCEWTGSIFRWLGLTTGALTSDTPPQQRKAIYQCNVIYGTASEFGFDYLRDHSMATEKSEQVQSGHTFAIIDEVDSILIDEARTPLIISGPAKQTQQMYDTLKDPVERLVSLQSEGCSEIASRAQKKLEHLGLWKESLDPVKLDKEGEAEKIEALTDLWVVSRGMPGHPIIRRLREHPDLRAALEKIDTSFYDKQREEERDERLSQLHIIVDERANDYELTDKGIAAWSSVAGPDHEGDFTMADLGHAYGEIDADPNLSDAEKIEAKTALQAQDSLHKERYHNIKQLLRAHLLMEKDVEYIVQEGKIVIIDENTGRPQPGRRFSDGLHQAIEAKESVPIQEETQTYATITLQNYFRMYDHLAGMSGTVMTEAREFKEIYKLDCVAIPTHRTCIRRDAEDEVYMTRREKYNAILAEVATIHASGRPILIGTESVEVSETLARILEKNKLKHTVLNARHHAQEAEIISKAGEPGAITLATNMAGRGTDIKLGAGVAELGGLHVIGSTRHHSRRIDRQLRGRSARLGDPGSSKFFVSFEDDLLRMFASPKMTALLQRLRPPEGEAISAPMLTRSIETAQKRLEQRNFTVRKHTLEYDDVMNKQRTELYKFRQEAIEASSILTFVYELLADFCAQVSEQCPRPFDAHFFAQAMSENFPISFTDSELMMTEVEEMEKKALHKLVQAFKQKIEIQKENIEERRIALEPLIQAGLIEQNLDESESIVSNVLRSILVTTIDSLWQEHLLHIDHLRTEVGMRSIGQKDPLVEFKHESFALFDRFSSKMRKEIAGRLFAFKINLPDVDAIKEQLLRAQMGGSTPFYGAGEMLEAEPTRPIEIPTRSQEQE